jgi:hypothetical protein
MAQRLIQYQDKPEATSVQNMKELQEQYEIYQQYIKAYNEEKDTTKESVSREDIVSKSVNVLDQTGVSVVTSNDSIPDHFESAKEFTEKETNTEITDFFDFLRTKICQTSQTELDPKHIVYISQNRVEFLEENRGVDESAKGDSFERDGDEDTTGQFAEAAFEQLLVYSQEHHNQEYKRLPDEEQVYAGDFLINGYITELKSCKASSRGQNITHRNHGHPTSTSMVFKQGVVPEIYSHAVVLDLREYGKGVAVAFSGLAPTLPQYNGIYAQEAKVFEGFSVTYIDDVEWYPVTDYGWHLLKNKVEKIQLD